VPWQSQPLYGQSVIARGAEGIPFGSAEDLQDQHDRRIAGVNEAGNALPVVIGL